MVILAKPAEDRMKCQLFSQEIGELECIPCFCAASNLTDCNK